MVGTVPTVANAVRIESKRPSDGSKLTGVLVVVVLE